MLVTSLAVPADAAIIHTAGLDCDSPVQPGSTWLYPMPITYRVGAGLDKAIVRQAFDMWTSRGLQFVESDTSANTINIETAAPGVYTELSMAGTYWNGVWRILGFNIWIDTVQIQQNGGHWGAVLASQIGRGVGLRLASCTTDALPTGWPGLTTADVRNRESLYPSYRTFMPVLYNER